MKRLNLKKTLKKIKFIDENGKLFGKYDLFLPLFIFITLTVLVLSLRVLLQKDMYITAELFASGGEWWWENPEPPYWLADPIKEGAIEYDPNGNILVEVLDAKKFEVGDRKMLWMKVKLKVTPMDKSNRYRFRREPLQIGSVIYVAPNNVKVNCNVMSIEGVEEEKQEAYRLVTLKEYEMFPWHVDKMKIGDTMLDNDGELIAEIVEKEVVNAEVMVEDDRGNVYARRNPLRRDITIKLKLKVTRTNGIDYFSFFQPLKVGYYMWIPFEKTNVQGNIVNIETID